MQLILTINGKKYLADVEVEEGEEVPLAGMPETASTLQAHPALPLAAAPVPAPAAGAPGAQEANDKICRSPIAGVVFKIVAQVGQQLEVTQQDGHTFPVLITEVTDTTVTLDANHPLAGRELTFDLKLVEIE